MSKRRDYCFTLNNFTDEEQALLRTIVANGFATYIIFGREVGENGTPHLQGYIRFNNAVRAPTAQRTVAARCWCQGANGSPDQNIAYCSKQGDFEEFGNRPQQGKRTDIEKAMDLVKGGGSYRDVVAQVPAAAARFESFIRSEIAYQVIERLEPFQLDFKVWQTQLLDHLYNDETKSFTHPPRGCREVVWLWSYDSLTGKSTFMQYLQYRFKHLFYSTPDLTWSNIMMMLKPEHRILHINLPRDVKEGLDTICMLIEKLSDRGIQSAGKYAGVIHCLDPLHIIVTSNIAPPSARIPERLVGIDASLPDGGDVEFRF